MPEGCSFYDSNRYVWTQDTRKWKPGTNALPMLKLEAQSDPKLYFPPSLRFFGNTKTSLKGVIVPCTRMIHVPCGRGFQFVP